MYQNAQYFKGMSDTVQSIKVDISGITSFVPLDPANSDYQQIMKLVEAGELTIAPAVE